MSEKKKGGTREEKKGPSEKKNDESEKKFWAERKKSAKRRQFLFIFVSLFKRNFENFKINLIFSGRKKFAYQAGTLLFKKNKIQCPESNPFMPFTTKKEIGVLATMPWPSFHVISIKAIIKSHTYPDYHQHSDL